MATFRNNPELKDDNNDGKILRWIHQPLTFEHAGIHVRIKENGHLLISSPGTAIKGSDELEYDEVEIPASLVFKMATSLQLTRTPKYMTSAEAAAMPKDAE